MNLRKRAGYTNRDDFAKALGVSESRYKSWETETRRLPIADACEIADFLGCTLDELAGRDFAPSEYSDPRQAELNHAWASINEQRKERLLENARDLATLERGDAERSALQDSEMRGA